MSTGRVIRRKSVDQLRREAESTGLRRALGPTSLVLFGIGCTIGAGIYVGDGIVEKIVRL
jgi:basic amino acid/polyamine antiporter, APA family